jgi:hypothetical protein
MMANTADRVLLACVESEIHVDATLAKRLAVLLTVTEEIEREGGAFDQDTLVALTGELSGNFSVRTLMEAWLATGESRVARAFATAFAESEQAFLARVEARLTRLGVGHEATIDVMGSASEVTLHALAIMLTRALATPLLVELMADEVPPLSQIAGEEPTVFFHYPTLRVAALARNGGYLFLLLSGDELPDGIENELML